MLITLSKIILCMKVLVIRFRQMGDAVLATSLLNSIRASFPHAEIHFVLNSNLKSLFEGHPAIDKIISFDSETRHSPLKYISKIFSLMVRERYDAIIDLRSTPNCLPFTIFSPFSKLRIGVDKPYTRLFFNRGIKFPDPLEDVVTHNLRFLAPLAKYGKLKQLRDFTLHITDEEKEEFRNYMIGEGIDFSRPILLCGVVSKLSHKCWPMDYMKDVISRILSDFPQWQLVFNYAPGNEESQARLLYTELGAPQNIFIDINASSMRKLVALAALSTAYFGNEGGARHISQAVGTPSCVVVSPDVHASNWIINNSVEALSISVNECREDLSVDSYSSLSYMERYKLISPAHVFGILTPFLNRLEQTFSFCSGEE